MTGVREPLGLDRPTVGGAKCAGNGTETYPVKSVGTTDGPRGVGSGVDAARSSPAARASAGNRTPNTGSRTGCGTMAAVVDRPATGRNTTQIKTISECRRADRQTTGTHLQL